MRRNNSSRQPTGGSNAGRRAEILRDAAKVFANLGFSAATVRDIGDEAGILSGSLYHHFESKDAMLEELLRPFVAGLVESYRSIAASDVAPSEQIRGLIKAAYQVVADEPTLVTILQNETSYLRAQPRYAFVQEADREVRAEWIGVIERGQATGAFRADLDPRDVYRTMMGAALSAVRWFHPRSQREVDALVENQTKLFLGGVEVPQRARAAKRAKA